MSELSFTAAEQLLVQRAKDLEADAKDLRRRAAEDRRNRVLLEQAAAEKELDASLEDFEDRVRFWISKLARELKRQGLTLDGSQSAWGGYVGQKIKISDTKTQHAAVIETTKDGFKW